MEYFDIKFHRLVLVGVRIAFIMMVCIVRLISVSVVSVSAIDKCIFNWIELKCNEVIRHKGSLSYFFFFYKKQVHGKRFVLFFFRFEKIQNENRANEDHIFINNPPSSWSETFKCRRGVFYKKKKKQNIVRELNIFISNSKLKTKPNICIIIVDDSGLINKMNNKKKNKKKMK